MSVIKRGAVVAPAIGRETIEVPEMGGEVVVRGMTMAERLVTGSADAGIDQMSQITFGLSRCVLIDDGEPLFTQDQWEAYGAKNLDVAIRLWTAVRRLSLLTVEDVEKKSESTPS